MSHASAFQCCVVELTQVNLPVIAGSCHGLCMRTDVIMTITMMLQYVQQSFTTSKVHQPHICKLKLLLVTAMDARPYLSAEAASY